MRAVDANVIVRTVVADDAEQARRAAAVLDAGDVWIPKTVLLETEWVLRGGYRLPRASVVESLRRVLGLRGATVEDHAAVAAAIDLHAEGVDFADALHLASSPGARAFLTFDRRLRTRAARTRLRTEVVLV